MAADSTTDQNAPGNKNGLMEKAAKWALSIGILAVVVYCGLMDLLPPTARDALIHHLAIPKLWLKAGGFYEIPWAIFSYYPMNLDLLYLGPLALGYDVGAQFIHHAFGLASAFLVFLYLRSRLGPLHGLAGALLFIATPIVMRLAGTAYVDLGLVFFTAAAGFGLMEWRETDRKKWFYISAVALGMAMGTKYQGIISAVPLVLAVLVWSRNKKGADGPIAATATYVVIALVVFSPWLIKNYILTGNPTYPLFGGIWGVENPFIGGAVDTFTWRGHAYGESFWYILLIPFRIFFQGVDNSPQFFDGVLNPGLLILPVLAVIRHRKNGQLLLAAAISVFFIFSIMMKGHGRIRYIVPTLPFLSVLAVYGLDALASWGGRFAGRKGATWISALVLTVCLLFNANWAVGHWREKNPWPYLSGSESRDQYLTRSLYYYPTMKVLNAKTPENARVLFLFVGNQGYYCERDYFYHTSLAGRALDPITARAKSASDIVAEFQKLGVTHLLIHRTLLIRYFNNTYDASGRRLWGEFLREKASVMHSENGVVLVRINHER